MDDPKEKYIDEDEEECCEHGVPFDDICEDCEEEDDDIFDGE